MDPGALQFHLGLSNAFVYLCSELSLPVGQQHPQLHRGVCLLELALVGIPGGDVSALADGLQHPEPDVLPDVRSSVQHPIHGAAGDSSHLGYGLYRRFGTHEITSFVCDVLLHNLS